MRSYQTLAVIGGILGLIIMFITFAIMGSLVIFLESFGNAPPEKEQLFTQLGVSTVLYMVAIIIPFALKKAKTVGYILFGLAVATLISAGGFGIIGFAILIAGGISAVRWKEKQIDSKNAMDLLNERFAKGEINKEEYEERKSTLEKK